MNFGYDPLQNTNWNEIKGINDLQYSSQNSTYATQSIVHPKNITPHYENVIDYNPHVNFDKSKGDYLMNLQPKRKLFLEDEGIKNDPIKYEYLGQKEEKIYSQSKTNMYGMLELEQRAHNFENIPYLQFYQQNMYGQNNQCEIPSFLEGIKPNDWPCVCGDTNDDLHVQLGHESMRKSHFFPPESLLRIDLKQEEDDQFLEESGLNQNQRYRYIREREINQIDAFRKKYKYGNDFHQKRMLKETSLPFRIVRDKRKQQKIEASIIQKKTEYDKNICRYITRQVVRSFANPEFKEKLFEIIEKVCPNMHPWDQENFYKETTEYFLGKIENLSGFRALKSLLLLNPPNDGIILISQKHIFTDFMVWFLQERYFRNILTGNMNDQLAFIHYKNFIMLHYIKKPHKWNSNKKTSKIITS